MNTSTGSQAKLNTNIKPQFKIKQRKRELVAKFEPELFRDKLFALLPEDKNDIEAYSNVLEDNESKLDFKKYVEPFFEIFIFGGLMGPGGLISEKERNPFSIFEAGDDHAIRERVLILVKLARRLKYIPKMLEESLSSFLLYINKFGENWKKLAVASALFTAQGIVPISILECTLKDHLINSGASLSFLTLYLQVFLKDQSIAPLHSLLRKAQLYGKLIEFYPPNKRSVDALYKHLDDAGLKEVSDYCKKQQKQELKLQTAAELKELTATGKMSEVIPFINEKIKDNKWAESEIPPLLWDNLVTQLDYSRLDQIENGIIKLINAWTPTLKAFCTMSKSELTLLLKIQACVYENAKILKYFKVIVEQLHKNGVLSDSCILYWFEKGAAPQGKTVLLKQMESFANWLAEQESDEE
ncbi:Basic leucine zipper and W2 domain-containing protein 2 [Boothiomyces sp. JEL0866]|nr:Basic leucine zipper and W2 domain-containing protein 2 [Boothiomyces sp. JEL0866]